jgi:competence protein ComEC
LIIVVVGGFFSFLSRRLKIFFSAVFVVVFTVLVGASAAVVRAAIMGIISLLALFYGRPYLVMLALFIAAFLMNLWNPKIIVYDVGFQLSFLATFGLVTVSSKILKYFEWLPKFFGLREAIVMTLSAQIFALPIILLNFGRLSIISPIANVFVLPFIPLAMIFGFFSVLLSVFSNVLGNIVGFFGYLVLELIIRFVSFFASFNFASVNLEWISWWMVLLYFFWLFKRIFISGK